MRAETTVYVAHGHYLIKPYEALPALTDAEDSAALLHLAAPGEGVFVRPGTFDGDVALTVETGDDLSAQDPAAWETVEDLEFLPGADNLVVVSENEVYDDIPPIPVTPDAAVSLRLYARGVAEARAIHAFEPDAIVVEHHLLQVRTT